MKTSKFYLIFLIASLAFGSICYISTSNLYISLGVFLISFFYLSIFAMKLIKKGQEKVRRFNECYQFINTFIISLSVKSSINGSFETTSATLGDDFKDYINDIDELSIDEKMDYLRRYFPFHVYSIFLNIINIWLEEGGDIISMSTHLIEEVRSEEEYVITSTSLAKKKVMEISFLWGICLAILLFLRFALNQFYSYINKLVFFPISICALFAFILFSYHLLILKINHLDLKGWSNHEE